MKVKHLVIAVAILGVASVATWFLKRDDGAPKADPRKGQLLLAADMVGQIRGVDLHTTNGNVEVATADGSDTRWIVRNYHELPADFSKVASLIKDLREAKVVQLASARPERIEQMQFDGTSITLRGADGAALRTFHLGKNYDSGGRFIKFDNENKAYVASISTYLDGTAKNWANTALVTAKPDEVVGLTVGFADGSSLRLKRDNGTAAWSSDELKEGETLKEADVNSLVSKLTGLRFSETADPTAEDVVAARANARSMQLTLTTGKTYDISMGRQPAPPAPPPPPPAEDGSTPEAPPAPKPGPVYVEVKSSDANEPINATMQKRAFQIYEWTFTSLPADRHALVNPAPPAPETPSSTPAETDQTPDAAADEAAAPAP